MQHDPDVLKPWHARCVRQAFVVVIVDGGKVFRATWNDTP